MLWQILQALLWLQCACDIHTLPLMVSSLVCMAAGRNHPVQLWLSGIRKYWEIVVMLNKI